ncbi:MAG TPA: hypothetical protein VMY05_09740 [Acidobacteriota bacterium]|nr:hypothetical protein [Acidobacteriota bacterium]
MVSSAKKVSFLYTNIGRGHPFYLDGIIDELVHRGHVKLVRCQSDVFEMSRGLSRLAWRTANVLYRKGSSGGIAGKVYGAIRSDTDYNRPGLMLHVMGRDIRRAHLSGAEPLVVAHPILVGILRGRENLVYQHGEVAAPSESLVMGASTVLVPVSRVAESFVEAGYARDQVVVSGLCIEPAIARQAADSYELRMERLASSAVLTGAFFSSGAEPAIHVDKLVEAAVSAVSAGGRAVLFARRGGRVARVAAGEFRRLCRHLEIVDPCDQIPADLPGATLVTYSSRREEASLSSKLFPLFDYLVAPSHERTNWALGLGLPMFAVGPTIGPFAPRNMQVLLDHGVAEMLDSSAAARELGPTVHQLRESGRLAAMAGAGWEKYPINGFERIAQLLQSRYGEQPADH